MRWPDAPYALIAVAPIKTAFMLASSNPQHSACAHPSRLAGLSVLSAEALVIALIVGIRAQSWAIGISVFIGVLVVIMTMASAPEKLGNALALIIGVAWGVAAFLLALTIGPTRPTAWVSAVLVGLVGFGAHIAGSGCCFVPYFGFFREEQGIGSAIESTYNTSIRIERWESLTYNRSPMGICCLSNR